MKFGSLREALRSLARMLSPSPGTGRPGANAASADWVYVNQDGSVRELAADERQYLSQRFDPRDGARAYVKASHEARDGWGSLSGFLLRRDVRRGVVIEPVNPDYVAVARNAFRESIEESRLVGDIVVENPDGSVSTTPNPNLTPKARFEALRQAHLQRQREHERRARHPDHLGSSGSTPTPTA